MLFMRCAIMRRDGNQIGATVYDKDDFPVEQYERKGSSAMSYVLLAALVAVVGFIAGLAAWTGA